MLCYFWSLKDRSEIIKHTSTAREDINHVVGSGDRKVFYYAIFILRYSNFVLLWDAA